MAFVAVGACVMTGGGNTGSGDGWIRFAAAVGEYSPAERQALMDRTRLEHESAPNGSTAIRLAILLAPADATAGDYAAALSLLDYAELKSSASDHADATFIRFFRPIVSRLAGQREALDSEAAANESLRRQLDAFRDLEERLNAEATQP